MPEHKKYGGLGVPELRRLRQLEEENQQLKQLVADLSLDKQMLQDVLRAASAKKSIKATGPPGGSAKETGLKFNGKLWHGPPRAFQPVEHALLFSSVDPPCTTSLVVEMIR